MCSILKRYICPATVIILAAWSSSSAATLHVAPAGNDTWSGRLAEPGSWPRWPERAMPSANSRPKGRSANRYRFWWPKASTR